MPNKPLAQQLQMLRCQLEAGGYAFDATQVKAIHRWESVTPVGSGAGAGAHAGDGSGDGSRGGSRDGAIGHLEGRPVYPLAHLLQLGETAALPVAGPAGGPVLLLEGYAVQVDKVSRPAQVPVSALRRLPRPAESAHDHISGLLRLDGALTLLLDPERLRPSVDGPGSRPARSWPAPSWPADEPWRNTVGEAGNAQEKTAKLLCFLPPSSTAGSPNDETYLAVSYRQAIEVAQGLSLTRLRSREPWLAGLVDWRERAVPVVDIAGLLGLEPSRQVDVSRVLIARSPRSTELFAFPASHLAPLPLPLTDDSTVVRTIDPPSPYVRAAYELSTGYLFLPDLERLIAAPLGMS